MAGIPDEEPDPEFEDDGSGRPPIPRRPAIPERPDDEPGSADEDNDDEKPQVVVLKEGKHLTEREAENVKRKERGLPPLPNPVDAAASTSSPDTIAVDSKPTNADPKNRNQTGSLSFSSSKGGRTSSTAKRKAIGGSDDPKVNNTTNGSTKKAKKARKTLLSFGDDA